MYESNDWMSKGVFNDSLPNPEFHLTSREVAAVLPKGLSQRLAYLSGATPPEALIDTALLSDDSLSILEEHGLIPSESFQRFIKRLFCESDHGSKLISHADVVDAVNDISLFAHNTPLGWTEFGYDVVDACRQRWAHLLS